MRAEGIQPVGVEAAKSLAAGLVLAVIVLCFPTMVVVLRPLITLIHEIGHAVVAWIFGYPSIPKFDFRYGGGLTSQFERSAVVVGAVYVLLAWGLFACRRKTCAWVTMLVIIGVYTTMAFTNIEQVLVLYMGHGTELVFAGLCFYRALSGRTLVNESERPAYAFVAFFLNLHAFRFAWGLISNDGDRVDYEAGKGEGDDVIMNDFSRIADEFWHVDLSVVVKIFLVCCFLPPILSFLVYRYEPRIAGFLWRWFVATPKEEEAPIPSLPVSPSSTGVQSEARMREIRPMNEETFFIWIGSGHEGPFSLDEIRTRLHQGSVTVETLCCRNGETEWRPIGELIPHP